MKGGLYVKEYLKNLRKESNTILIDKLNYNQQKGRINKQSKRRSKKGLKDKIILKGKR